MYFSLITPTEGRVHEAVHERLDGPYADHQWLWRWFPAERGTPRDFLFRRHDGGEAPRYYVVSRRTPSQEGGVWQLQTREYEPQVSAGDRLQFELRANPTVRHGRDGKSKRHDVVMEAKKKLLSARGLSRWGDWQGEDKPSLDSVVHDACNDWLKRRGEALGFDLDSESLVVEAYDQHQEKPGQTLCFSTVDLTGQLVVTDPVAFQRALLEGIGSAKAFGCGLLLVRRSDA